jgi:hypothetical protein
VLSFSCFSAHFSGGECPCGLCRILCQALFRLDLLSFCSAILEALLSECTSWGRTLHVKNIAPVLKGFSVCPRSPFMYLATRTPISPYNIIRGGHEIEPQPPTPEANTATHKRWHLKQHWWHLFETGQAAAELSCLMWGVLPGRYWAIPKDRDWRESSSFWKYRWARIVHWHFQPTSLGSSESKSAFAPVQVETGGSWPEHTKRSQGYGWNIFNLCHRVPSSSIFIFLISYLMILSSQLNKFKFNWVSCSFWIWQLVFSDVCSAVGGRAVLLGWLAVRSRF